MQSGSVHVCYGVGYTALVDRMLEVIAGVGKSTVGKCFGAAGSRWPRCGSKTNSKPYSMVRAVHYYYSFPAWHRCFLSGRQGSTGASIFFSLALGVDESAPPGATRPVE